HQHEAIHTRFHGLACKCDGVHICEDETSIIMHTLHNSARAAQRRDDARCLVAHDEIEVFIEPRVGTMDDYIGRPGRVLFGEARGDAIKPLIKIAHAARIRSGKAADNTLPASGKNKLWPRDQEHWRCDKRKIKARAPLLDPVLHGFPPDCFPSPECSDSKTSSLRSTM